MLTPHIVRCMRDGCTNEEVLTLLNSNSETPQFIWHNGTRQELLKFIEEQQQPGAEVQVVILQQRILSIQSELFGAEFRFDTFEDELIIGDVFVRVYIQQPQFQLQAHLFVSKLSFNHFLFPATETIRCRLARLPEDTERSVVSSHDRHAGENYVQW